MKCLDQTKIQACSQFLLVSEAVSTESAEGGAAAGTSVVQAGAGDQCPIFRERET